MKILWLSMDMHRGEHYLKAEESSINIYSPLDVYLLAIAISATDFEL